MYGAGFGNRSYGVDVDGDGIADVKVTPGYGIDVDGDGIVDYRVGTQVTPTSYGSYGTGNVYRNRCLYGNRSIYREDDCCCSVY